MQVKVCPILIIAMLMLLVVMPASAYDYRGVPRPGDNSADISDTEVTSEDVAEDPALNLAGLDLSALLDSDVMTSLIMMIIGFFLQLFSGSYS